MELRHLRYFLAVADALNFTKAAVHLRVAQPALSRQVQDLEDEIGVDLLKRSPRGVTLTAEGKLFLVETREILQRVDEAVTKTRALARGEYGELHIGYAPSPTVEILPAALAAFQKEAPGVTVVLHDLSEDEMRQGLLDGTLELALDVEHTEEGAAGVDFEELRRYPFCVAMAPQHALAKKRAFTLEEIATQPLVGLKRKDYPEYHRIIARMYAGMKGRPRIVVECDSATSLMTALEGGSGMAITNHLFKQAAGKRLVFRPISNAAESLAVGIVRAVKGDVTPAGEKFCEVLRRVGKGKLMVGS